jgi:hypothetical protein
MAKRDLVRCLCDYCGSSFEVFYCGFKGDYICKECLNVEKEEEEDFSPKTHLDYLEKIGAV